MDTLKVRPRVQAHTGQFALVHDYRQVGQLVAGAPVFHRWVGFQTVVDDKGRASLKFVDGDHVVENSHEYRRHVADGDLWPADAATAKACGVEFDPTFGEPSKAAGYSEVG